MREIDLPLTNLCEPQPNLFEHGADEQPRR
jgi:hypothetical protein